MQCWVILGGHSASLSSCLHYPSGEAHPGWQGGEDQTPTLAQCQAWPLYACKCVCVCTCVCVSLVHFIFTCGTSPHEWP